MEVITQVTKPCDTSHGAFVISRSPPSPVNPELRRRRRQQHIGHELRHPPRRLYPDDSHNSNLVIQPCHIESNTVIVRWRHSPCGNMRVATTQYRFPGGLKISLRFFEVFLVAESDWRSLRKDSDDLKKCTNGCLITRHLQVWDTFPT